MNASFIDRTAQRLILERLRQSYPSRVTAHTLHELEGVRNLDAHVAYLNEHRLLKTEMSFTHDGNYTPRWIDAVITAAGLDFLEDDGGMTAILGKITVKLDAESVRELLAAKVQSEPSLPEDKKNSLLAAIRKLPETILQEAAKRLLAEGLQHAPDAIQLLQTWVARAHW